LKNTDSVIYSDIGGVPHAGPADGSYPLRPLTFAAKSKTITVTHADRKGGTKANPAHCTLANVLKSQPGVLWAVVMRSVAYVGYADHTDKYELSVKARDEVIANDTIPGLLRSAVNVNLNPVRPTKTTAGKRATIAKHLASKAAGTAKTTGPKTISVDVLAQFGVRNGIGTVGTV